MSSGNLSKPGKRRKRSELKTLLTLIMLKLTGPIGRYRLKEMLGLSDQEGLVRLMLADLKNEHLVKTSKAGCELTQKGERHLEEALKRHGIVDIKEMSMKLLKTASESFVFHCRGLSMPVSVTALRDVAVRYGSSGAVLIQYDHGILAVPGVYPNLEEEYPSVSADLHQVLNLSDGDTILVSFSEDKWRALEGGLSMAIHLAGGLS